MIVNNLKILCGIINNKITMNNVDCHEMLRLLLMLLKRVMSAGYVISA
jgi:hypothetical protein